MPFFEWTDQLSVNIAEIDSHHKRLIELINRLHDSKNSGDDQLVAGEVLTELSNYAMYHFFAEEQLMRQYQYPGFEPHRNEHLRFTERTLDFVQDYHHGRIQLSQTVLAFLKDWLRHHILTIDQQLIPFLKEKGVT